MTFREFLKNEGLYGKLNAMNPGTMAVNREKKLSKSDMAKTHDTGQSTIKRMTRLNSLSTKPATPSTGTPIQATIKSKLGKPGEYFKEPTIGHVQPPLKLIR